MAFTVSAIALQMRRKLHKYVIRMAEDLAITAVHRVNLIYFSFCFENVI